MDPAKFYSPRRLTSKTPNLCCSIRKSHPPLNLQKLSSIWPGESTTGSLTSQQSTKLEAAMIELLFAEAEAKLIRKQASIKAEKTILMKKRALAETMTTFDAMELALNGKYLIEESCTRDRILDYVLVS